MRILRPATHPRLGCLLALLVCAAGRLSAQRLPSEPIVFADGRMVVGGDIFLTGSDIAFAMEGLVLSGALPPEDRAALSSVLRQGTAVTKIQLHGEEFAALPMPLTTGDAPPEGDGPVALVLRSRTGLRQFLSEIHTDLAVTAIVAVLLATLLSFAVARPIAFDLAPADLNALCRDSDLAAHRGGDRAGRPANTDSSKDKSVP